MERTAGSEPGESRWVVRDRVQHEAGAPGRVPSPGGRRIHDEPIGGELDGAVGSAPDPRAARPRDGDREAGMGQEREQRGVRLSHDDLDRRALTASHLPDDPRRAAEGPDPGGRSGRRLVGGDPLGKRRDDLIGPERRAVVKLDVLAQPEGPDQPVAGDGPRRRERGLDVASLPEGDQPLVEQAHRQELGRRRGLRRVQIAGTRRTPTWSSPAGAARATRATATTSRRKRDRNAARAGLRRRHSRRGALGRIGVHYRDVVETPTRVARGPPRSARPRAGTGVARFEASGRQRAGRPRARTGAGKAPQLDFFFQRRL